MPLRSVALIPRFLRMVFVFSAGLLAGVTAVQAQTTPAAYRTEDAFPGLSFNQPLAFATPLGETNRIFVLEKPGRIQAIANLATAPSKQLFLDLSSKVQAASEGGILGLAFHPNFASNRYFYVFYTTTATTSAGTGLHDRLSRFTALAAPATNADILATEVPMISQFDEAGNHNGGDIHFGPDGYLYVALGDEGGGDDQYNNSQRIDRDFFSGILRLDVDAKTTNLVPNAHPAVHADTYRVPVDNPFVAATTFNGAVVTTTAVRTEFWAVGLRNPWRFSFDAPTGRLIAGDVGQGAREEIDIITKGGNYGWGYREGLIAGPKRNPPAGVTFVDPIWDADRTTAGSITGGVVYRGTRWPDLIGRYVFGDYVRNRVFAMTFPASGAVQVDTVVTEDTPVAFGADPRNGDILIASINTGLIRRLVGTTPPNTAPVITQQPVPQVVTVGRGVSFSATSSLGSGRWQVATGGTGAWTDLSDNSTYSGTGTSTLTITGSTAALSGNTYRFVTGTGASEVISDPAKLTVNALFFPSPAGLAFDGLGTLLVTDSTASTLHKVAIAGTATLFAGTADQAGSTDGTGTSARFNQPVGIVIGGGGVAFVADTANATIRRVGTDGAVTTFAGSATGRGNNDATGIAATFSNPQGVAIDAGGNLYVADATNHTIRRITSAGAVTTFAGAAGTSGSADGAATVARFNRPGAVARDTAGNTYVADTLNNTIRRITPNGTVSTLAGLAGVSGSDNGTGSAALFNQPAGLVVSSAGDLYVADTGNNAIRKVTSAGVVTTVAGLSTVAGQQDGAGNTAWFNHPRALAFDSSGNLYVADSGNAALRRITSAGAVNTLVLVAGTTTPPSNPNPPTDPNPPTNPPPSSGGGGGGGAISPWFAGLLLLMLGLRRVARRASL